MLVTVCPAHNRGIHGGKSEPPGKHNNWLSRGKTQDIMHTKFWWYLSICTVPTIPIMEPTVTCFYPSGVCPPQKRNVQCDQFYSWSFPVGRLWGSRNAQECWCQMFLQNKYARTVKSNKTYCLISGLKSNKSFPWTTPALLIRNVGWPICHMNFGDAKICAPRRSPSLQLFQLRPI